MRIASLAHNLIAKLIAILICLFGFSLNSYALTLGPEFSADYSVTSLGAVPGLPPSYGGLVFKAGDPNTLLIGGQANAFEGRIYEVGVVRDVNNHVTGFSGNATAIGDVGEFNDGGVAYGPGGVLFTAQWPTNSIGQTRPGDTDENRVDDLTPFGVGGSSIAALNFIPPGISNVGAMKIVSWASGNWYDVELSPDGAGTFDIVSITQVDLDPIAGGVQSLPGGPEGFIYIDELNEAFTVDSILVSEFSDGSVGAYEIDANGDPILSTRRDFLTGVTNAEGAAIDPLTGDFLFSTFGASTNQVAIVTGFMAPIPIPPAFILFGSVLIGLFGISRRKS